MFTTARLIIAGCVIVAILALGGYVYFTRKALREANARVVAAEQSTSSAMTVGGHIAPAPSPGRAFLCSALVTAYPSSGLGAEESMAA